MQFKERICKFCGLRYTPRHVSQKFCCKDCRKQAQKEAYQEKAHPKYSDPNEKFKPVFDFIKKHYEETGEHLKYGQAVLLMEKEGEKA